MTSKNQGFDKTKMTLAIYGIPDISDNSWPEFVHDHNIALFDNGQLSKYLQLERLSGIKHDKGLPSALYDILKKSKLLDCSSFDLVFVDNPVGRTFINKKGNLRFEAERLGGLKQGLERGFGFWMDKEIKAFVLNHELAHVYSNLPFYGPFKDNSLHVHFDGGASKSNFSAWHFRDNQMKLMEYHWDLKWLSSLFNANALVFAMVNAGRKEQLAVPGKFMGLSSYGEYSEKMEKWLRSNHFFSNCWSKKSPFFTAVENDWGLKIKEVDAGNIFIQDIAATIQAIFTREVIKVLKRLKNESGAEDLYYSGGSALSIVTNAELLKQQVFKTVAIPPCTNDSGLSLGAGAYMEWQKHGRMDKHHPWMNNWEIGDYQTTYDHSTIEALVQLISRGKVVGICNSYGEVGPRALGNRSIIARADQKDLAKKISMQLKGREWFRPLAPVMLQKNAELVTGRNNIPTIARYMLTEFFIEEQFRPLLDGAVHVDGTARIQVLDERNQNPFLYDLLEVLDKNKNLKALINTSFNGKGEPIVHTCEQAIASGVKMGLDYVVLNGKLKKLKD